VRIPVAAAVVEKAATVPSPVLDHVGVDGHPVSPSASVNPINVVRGPGAGLPRVDGKPVLFFYGAEWCPYCAAERWSLIVALSRFGTFSGLSGVASSAGDYAPNTQTFTFHGSTYTSAYIAFAPVEAEDMNEAPLDAPNSAERGVLKVWNPKLGFPFIDIAGRYLGGLPTWIDPIALAGLSRSEIAARLWQPTDPVGGLLDANANYLSAAICAVDGGRPGAVCSSAGVTAAATQLRSLPAAVPVS
jgi:thiol-disulfide isomerase/thioredoxin